jgi:hypothetical protein
VRATQSSISGYLSTLKAGDKVFISGRYGGYGSDIQTAVVSHVSPTGRIITTSKRVFDRDGHERGRTSSSWGGRARIVEPTDEIRETVRRAELIDRIESRHDKLRRAKWEGVKTSVLASLADLLDERTVTPEAPK